MQELYHNFFDKFCGVTKFEELEIDTDSPYLALSEHDLYNCIRPAMKKSGALCEVETVRVNIQPPQQQTFSTRSCCAKHLKHDKREPGLFKEDFRGTELISLLSKTYCCYDSQSNKFKLSSKGWNERTLEDSDDDPMSKYLQKFVRNSYCNVNS